MKGLLLKDFYMVLKYCRSLVLVVVAFTAVSVFSDNNSFFMAYPAIICGMIPQTLLAYEERAQWDKYLLVFPYSRKQIVSAKYIMSFFAVALAVAFSMTVHFIRFMNTGTGTIGELMNTHLLIAAVGLLGPSISMPVIFKYGTEKGRILYLITVGVICAVSAMLAFNSDMTPMPQTATPIGAPIFLVSAVLFAISWLISIRIYEKREVLAGDS